MKDIFVDYLIPLSEFLVIGGSLAAVILPLINALKDPKDLMKSLMGVGVMAVIFLISYGISGNEVTPLYTQFFVDAGLSKLIGGSLIMCYVLGVISIIGIVVNSIMKFIR